MNISKILTLTLIDTSLNTQPSKLIVKNYFFSSYQACLGLLVSCANNAGNRKALLLTPKRSIFTIRQLCRMDGSTLKFAQFHLNKKVGSFENLSKKKYQSFRGNSSLKSG